MTNINFKKQLPFNLLSNVMFFGFNIVIGIWMVPFLIKHLGVEGYGFIPLAWSITGYVGLITIALNSAVSRYLVIALQNNDADGANKIFNTAFWSLALISIILVPLSALFSWLIPNIFNVPKYLTVQVQILFFAILLAFIVSFFSSIFSVSTFVNNRLDLRNLVDISNSLVRTLLIVFFFIFLSPSLVFVGIATLFGGLISLLLGYFFFKKLTPLLKISRRYYDQMRLKEITSMGGWLIVSQIGSLLFLQIDLIVANIFLGAHDAGKYGAILQWSVLLRSMAGIIAGVLTPIILINYAKGEHQKIINMSQRSVKFMGLGMAVPVGLLCGFAHSLLIVWLGKGFVQYTLLLRLLTFHLVINLAVLPLYAVTNAHNRLRIPGIVTIVMGFINLLLAIILAKWVGLGVYGIAIAGAIMLTAKNAIFVPIYSAHVLKIPYDIFIKPMAVGVFLAGISAAIAWTFSHYIVIDGWFKLFMTGGLALILVTMVGVVLLGKDRDYLWSLVIVRA